MDPIVKRLNDPGEPDAGKPPVRFDEEGCVHRPPLTLQDHREILVVNAPQSFEPELVAIDGVKVIRDIKGAKAVCFAIVFATKQAEVDKLSKIFARKAHGDVLLWFAYPKGSSKRYRCDFNRDTGWRILRKMGYDSVRAVAIDEDWTALRFRRVEFIKPAVKS
jgi:hypothetical protein